MSDFFKNNIGVILLILFVLVLSEILHEVLTDETTYYYKMEPTNSSKENEPIEKVDEIQAEKTERNVSPFLLYYSPNYYDSIAQEEKARERIEKKVSKEFHKLERKRTGFVTAKYIFKNRKPLGKEVNIKYDNFYKKYTLSFIKENGNNVEIILLEENFNVDNLLSAWSFKYKNDIYEISDVPDLFIPGLWGN
jgi:hypothetical protein